MKVKELISELKRLPQNLRVDVAMHDNAEWESAGIVCSILLFNKSDYFDDVEIRTEEDKGMLSDMPDECIILRC